MRAIEPHCKALCKVGNVTWTAMGRAGLCSERVKKKREFPQKQSKVRAELQNRHGIHHGDGGAKS